jgi:putative transposase
MDGKERWMDNVFIERLWRQVNYEHVYPHSHDSIADMKAGLKTYFSFFYQERTHQSLARQTPDEGYFVDRPRKAA